MNRTYLLEYLLFLDNFFKEYKNMCHEKMNINSDDIILDFGSGLGIDAYKFLKKAREVVGIDIDKEFLEYATINNMASNIKYKLATDGLIPFPDNYFNTVFVDRVFQHIPEDKIDKTFNEIYRCLKPGGRVYISETDYTSKTWQGSTPEVEKKLLQFRTQKQSNVYAAKEMARYLEKSNFSIKEKNIYPIKIKDYKVVDKIFKLSYEIKELGMKLDKVVLTKDFYFSFNMNFFEAYKNR